MNFIRGILSVKKWPMDVKGSERARHLVWASLVLLIIPIPMVVVNSISGSADRSTINVGLIILVFVQIPVLWFIRRGHLRAASVIILFTSWIVMTWIASKVAGVGDMAVVSYFLIILGAGYLLGWRAVTMLTTWTILAVWMLAFMEAVGYLQPMQGNPLRIALDLTIIFVIASLEIYVVLTTLTRSLNTAQTELAERQRIEQMLRNEREKLALALSASKMETWEWDIESGRVFWSDGIETLFGLHKGSFDGKYESYLSLVHPEDLERVQSSIERALTDPLYDYVIEHRLAGHGNLIWIEGRGRVYRDTDGKPFRMAGTVVDITDRKMSEGEREELIRELAAKNTELEQFTYTVSHDLKAPLITIKGFLGFLTNDIRSGDVERVEQDASRITDAVDKMHALLGELLELSRIGRMMNPPEAVPFADIVDEALNILHGRLQKIQVNIHDRDSLPVVMGDRQRLLEVIQNLVDNAAKFSSTSEAPLIQIGAQGMENSMPILYVKDNGIGIAPEHHERIFGLFQKLNPSAEGTGVGLSLVRRIVEFHGGRIWIESQEGKGAAFFFTLPFAK